MRVVSTAAVLDQPEASSAVLGTVPSGETLEVLDSRGPWVLVRPSGGSGAGWRTGWVSSDKIEPLDSEASVVGAGAPGSGEGEAAGQAPMDVRAIVDTIKNDPVLVNETFYYDAGFAAVGSFAWHNHFAKRSCIGYLVSDGDRLAYRFIRSLPGLGSDNDAFDVDLSNIKKVEYRFYEASAGILDQFPERLSVEFFFEPKVMGLVADWEKGDIKFDIWNVHFANRLMEYLDAAGIETVEKR